MDMRTESWGPQAGAPYKGRSAVMAWLAMVVTAGAMLLTAFQHALPGPGSDGATSSPSVGSVAAEVDPREIRLVSGRAPAP